MRLYGYFRSSAAYRTRIALALKGLDYAYVPVDLRGDQQSAADYRRLNPQGLVPTLVDDGFAVPQSLAIVEYLEETHPEPPLLPQEPRARARVRALAFAIACDIHPLNNLRVLKFLGAQYGQDEEGRNRWARHWIALGFAAVERELFESRWTGRFCHGDAPGLADLCLVPQLYNARRVAAPLDAYPTILRIAETCRTHPAFQKARPEAQPDWPKEVA